MSAGATSPVRFGAKLSRATQPTGKDHCDDHAHVRHDAVCTWVAVEAFENGGHERAPKDGTIGKVRLISCVGGSFTLQVAHAKPSNHLARVVRNGPKITYVKDSRSTCGGNDEDDYRIQRFFVNLRISKGDYIAVKAKSIGFIHNSSSGDTQLFDPALSPGGSYHLEKSSTGGMLIQFQYK